MQCIKCGHVRQAGDPAPDSECPKCGVIYAKAAPKMNAAQARLHAAIQTGDWSGFNQGELAGMIQSVRISTIDNMPGKEILDSGDVVFGDYAFAFAGIEEFIGGLARDIVGSGASSGMNSKVAAGRAIAINNLKFSVLSRGFDGAVGVKIDYEEFSGATGRGILVVTASGTPVKTR